MKFNIGSRVCKIVWKRVDLGGFGGGGGGSGQVLLTTSRVSGVIDDSRSECGNSGSLIQQYEGGKSSSTTSVDASELDKPDSATP
jgi:hypothetical protein